MKDPVELISANKQVSDCRYRVILSDRVIVPDEADKLWNKWKNE